MNSRPRLGDYFENRQEPGCEGLPTLSVTMNDGIVHRSELDRRTETTLLPDEHLLIRRGDIAYNMMRMWQGACGLADIDGLVSPAYVVLAPKKNIDARFAYHWFKSDRMIYLFWAYSHGLTEDRLRLYFDDLAEIPIAPPCIEQQRRVVSVLDVWDRAIDRTDGLIAAKRLRKTAIVGRALTINGAKRGFIRDFADVNPKNRPILRDTMVSFVAMQDVSGNGELISTADRLRSELGNGYTQFAEGDVLVAKITPCFENGKGALAAGLTNATGFGTTEFHVVRPHDPADADYLHQITMTRGFRVSGERHMTGSAGQRRVPAEFIEDFPVYILGKRARREVGRLLAGLDKELSNLERTLLSLRAQKRGLMHRLLSGDSQLGDKFDPASDPPAALTGATA